MRERLTSVTTEGAGVPDRTLPLMSVVVPARNEERYLEETLRSLMAQTYPADRMEILVVDGLSTDRTREIALRLSRECPGIRLLTNLRVRPAAARNIGIRNAGGDFIAIVDAHSLVERDFLSRAYEVFERTGSDCIGRPVSLFVATDGYVQRTIALARMSRLGHNPVSNRYGAGEGLTNPLSVGIFYQRHVFERVGFFDESLDACEDVEFNARVQQAGLSTWFEPRMLCTYHPRGSFLALYRQLKRYAFSRFQLCQRGLGFHPSQAAPAAGLLLFAACLTLGIWLRPALLAAAGLVLGYMAVVLLFCLITAGRSGIRYLPALPAAYLAMHLGAAVGFLHAASCHGSRRLRAGGRPSTRQARVSKVR